MPVTAGSLFSRHWHPCAVPRADWPDTVDEKKWDATHGDREQEIVFIGAGVSALPAPYCTVENVRV
jgi:hypothetical protein